MTESFERWEENKGVNLIVAKVYTLLRAEFGKPQDLNDGIRNETDIEKVQNPILVKMGTDGETAENPIDGVFGQDRI